MKSLVLTGELSETI